MAKNKDSLLPNFQELLALGLSCSKPAVRAVTMWNFTALSAMLGEAGDSDSGIALRFVAYGTTSLTAAMRNRITKFYLNLEEKFQRLCYGSKELRKTRKWLLKSLDDLDLQRKRRWRRLRARRQADNKEPRLIHPLYTVYDQNLSSSPPLSGTGSPPPLPASPITELSTFHGFTLPSDDTALQPRPKSLSPETRTIHSYCWDLSCSSSHLNPKVKHAIHQPETSQHQPVADNVFSEPPLPSENPVDTTSTPKKLIPPLAWNTDNFGVDSPPHTPRCTSGDSKLFTRKSKDEELYSFEASTKKSPMCNPVKSVGLVAGPSIAPLPPKIAKYAPDIPEELVDLMHKHPDKSNEDLIEMYQKLRTPPQKLPKDVMVVEDFLKEYAVLEPPKKEPVDTAIPKPSRAVNEIKGYEDWSSDDNIPYENIYYETLANYVLTTHNLDQTLDKGNIFDRAREILQELAESRRSDDRHQYRHLAKLMRGWLATTDMNVPLPKSDSNVENESAYDTDCLICRLDKDRTPPYTPPLCVHLPRGGEDDDCFANRLADDDYFVGGDSLDDNRKGGNPNALGLLQKLPSLDHVNDSIIEDSPDADMAPMVTTPPPATPPKFSTPVRRLTEWTGPSGGKLHRSEALKGKRKHSIFKPRAKRGRIDTEKSKSVEELRKEIQESINAEKMVDESLRLLKVPPPKAKRLKNNHDIIIQHPRVTSSPQYSKARTHYLANVIQRSSPFKEKPAYLSAPSLNASGLGPDVILPTWTPQVLGTNAKVNEGSQSSEIPAKSSPLKRKIIDSVILEGPAPSDYSIDVIVRGDDHDMDEAMDQDLGFDAPADKLGTKDVNEPSSTPKRRSMYDDTSAFVDAIFRRSPRSKNGASLNKVMRMPIIESYRSEPESTTGSPDDIVRKLLLKPSYSSKQEGFPPEYPSFVRYLLRVELQDGPKLIDNVLKAVQKSQTKVKYEDVDILRVITIGCKEKKFTVSQSQGNYTISLKSN